MSGETIIGQVIDGRYQIVELIGEGGMGRVYRAEQLRLGRSVAVKVLTPEWSAVPQMAKRFEREAIAVAKIDHPNCVSVQDFGQLGDGSLYLVMSYLPGQLLSHAIEEQPFALARALHVTRHILSGLAHAHNAGIIHRDVKPENVMLVSHEGDPDFAKLFDFGIVKLIEAEEAQSSKLTTVGQRFGTPCYMSPEQSLGKPVDARTDLYSLTVVLFEMLVGRPPFDADDNESLLVMHAAKTPPTLSEAAKREFPDEIEELIKRGLAKDPDQRFASAAQYLEEIDRVARPKPVAPPPRIPSGLYRAYRTVGKRLRSHRVLGAMGIALLVAGSALALYLVLRPDHAAYARALIASGHPQEAATYLQGRLKDIADDAKAQLELGHAYAASRRYDDALVAYERVRSLERSLADDRAMRTNLMLMLDDERNETAAGAARFLIQLLDDAGASARLVEIASRHRSLAHRAAMRDLAESLGLADRIDLVASYRLDLEQGPLCPDRQKAVAKLRALRDPAAVAALKKAIDRKGNACLKDDAADAVRYLDSLGTTE
jgi:tetratricopeptide (TPR) repeat protein